MSRYWYVLRSKPNNETFLATQLEYRYIDYYNPQIKVNPVNPRSRRIKPYFPGYIFINTDLSIDNYVLFERIPGAVGFVFLGGEAAIVPEAILRGIQFKVDEINRTKGYLLNPLKKGDPLKINAGPFQGYEAIFDMRISGSERVNVLLTMLQGRKLKVELPAGYVNLEKVISTYS